MRASDYRTARPATFVETPKARLRGEKSLAFGPAN